MLLVGCDAFVFQAPNSRRRSEAPQHRHPERRTAKSQGSRGGTECNVTGLKAWPRRKRSGLRCSLDFARKDGAFELHIDSALQLAVSLDLVSLKL
jgi:hypothetical protein